MPATIDRPQSGEFASFYARYIDYLPRDSDVVATLTSQLDSVAKVLALAGESRASYRYAEGKWSVREVVGHLADSERVFAYRLMRIARGDATPLPGFDENDYVRAAAFERRPLAGVASEWTAVRRATIAMVSGIEPGAWERRGTATDAAISARALLYIIVGHTEHHLGVLRTRYELQ